MVRETRHLWVGNLPVSVTEERIWEHFKRYGRVQSVKQLPRKEEDPCQCATVAFVDIKSASKAHNSENKLDDRILKTDYYEPPCPSTGVIHKTDREELRTSNYSSPVTPRSPRYSVGCGEDRAYERNSSHFYDRREGETCGKRGSISSIYLDGDDFRGRPRDRYRSVNSYSSERAVGLNQYRNWTYDGRYSESSDDKEQKIKKNSETNSKSVIEKKGQKGKCLRSGSLSRSGSESRSSLASSSSSSSPSSRSSSPISRSNSKSPSNLSRERLHSSVTTVHGGRNSPEGTDDKRPVSICVRNLPARSSGTSLKDGLFHEYKKYGKVTAVKIFGQGSDRYALVTFKRPEDAEKAVELSQEKLFFGSKIEVVHFSCDEELDYKLYDSDVDEYHPKASRILFVGNLEKDTTTNELRKLFDQFGEIIEIEIKKATSGGHAFVQYCDISSVVRAMKGLDGQCLGNSKLKLGFGKTSTSTCLWVAGVAEAISEKYLGRQFARHGVVGFTIIDRGKGQALIFFEQIAAAQKAVLEMRGRSLGGTRLQVDFASRECQVSFFDHLQKSGFGDKSWDRFHPRGIENIRRLWSTNGTGVHGGLSSRRLLYSDLVPERRHRNYDEYSQGSCASYEDSFEAELREYGYSQRERHEYDEQSSDRTHSSSPIHEKRSRDRSLLSGSPVPSPTRDPEDGGCLQGNRTKFEIDRSKFRKQIVVSGDKSSGSVLKSKLRDSDSSPNLSAGSKKDDLLWLEEDGRPIKRAKLNDEQANVPSGSVLSSKPNSFQGVERSVELVNSVFNKIPSVPERNSDLMIPIESFQANRKSVDLKSRRTISNGSSADRVTNLSESDSEVFNLFTSPKEIPAEPKKARIISETDGVKVRGYRKSTCDDGNDDTSSSSERQRRESEDSRPGTPLCDEIPQDIPVEPRRMRNKSSDGPLSLPLPMFAHNLSPRPVIHSPKVNTNSPRAVHYIRSPPQASHSIKSPPPPNSSVVSPCSTSVTLKDPRLEKEAVHVDRSGTRHGKDPRSSSHGTPVSPRKHSSKNLIDVPSDHESSPCNSPRRPSLEDQIRMLDEKFEKWSGSTRGLVQTIVETPKVELEKFRSRHREIDLEELRSHPSPIVMSLLSRKSVFDEDSKRLETCNEKYEPKDIPDRLPSLSKSVKDFPVTNCSSVISFSKISSVSSWITSVSSTVSNRLVNENSIANADNSPALKSPFSVGDNSSMVQSLKYPFPSHSYGSEGLSSSPISSPVVLMPGVCPPSIAMSTLQPALVEPPSNTCRTPERNFQLNSISYKKPDVIKSIRRESMSSGSLSPPTVKVEPQVPISPRVKPQVASWVLSLPNPSTVPTTPTATTFPITPVPSAVAAAILPKKPENTKSSMKKDITTTKDKVNALSVNQKDHARDCSKTLVRKDALKPVDIPAKVTLTDIPGIAEVPIVAESGTICVEPSLVPSDVDKLSQAVDNKPKQEKKVIKKETAVKIDADKSDLFKTETKRKHSISNSDLPTSVTNKDVRPKSSNEPDFKRIKLNDKDKKSRSSSEKRESKDKRYDKREERTKKHEDVSGKQESDKRAEDKKKKDSKLVSGCLKPEVKIKVEDNDGESKDSSSMSDDLKLKEERSKHDKKVKVEDSPSKVKLPDKKSDAKARSIRHDDSKSIKDRASDKSKKDKPRHEKSHDKNRDHKSELKVERTERDANDKASRSSKLGKEHTHERVDRDQRGERPEKVKLEWPTEEKSERSKDSFKLDATRSERDCASRVEKDNIRVEKESFSRGDKDSFTRIDKDLPIKIEKDSTRNDKEVISRADKDSSRNDKEVISRAEKNSSRNDKDAVGRSDKDSSRNDKDTFGRSDKDSSRNDKDTFGRSDRDSSRNDKDTFGRSDKDSSRNDKDAIGRSDKDSSRSDKDCTGRSDRDSSRNDKDGNVRSSDRESSRNDKDANGRSDRDSSRNDKDANGRSDRDSSRNDKDANGRSDKDSTRNDKDANGRSDKDSTRNDKDANGRSDKDSTRNDKDGTGRSNKDFTIKSEKDYMGRSEKEGSSKIDKDGSCRSNKEGFSIRTERERKIEKLFNDSDFRHDKPDRDFGCIGRDSQIDRSDSKERKHEKMRIKDRCRKSETETDDESLFRRQKVDSRPRKSLDESDEDRLKRSKKKKKVSSDDSCDEDYKPEAKKHSIFDVIIDENEPVYFSMYDKVKARSCKNMQKQQTEDKKCDSLKEKFSALKQKRAKREEKKRSTSIDDDTDGENIYLKDGSCHRKQKRIFMLGSSSSDDDLASYQGYNQETDETDGDVPFQKFSKKTKDSESDVDNVVKHESRVDKIFKSCLTKPHLLKKELINDSDSDAFLPRNMSKKKFTVSDLESTDTESKRPKPVMLPSLKVKSKKPKHVDVYSEDSDAEISKIKRTPKTYKKSKSLTKAKSVKNIGGNEADEEDEAEKDILDNDRHSKIEKKFKSRTNRTHSKNNMIYSSDDNSQKTEKTIKSKDIKSELFETPSHDKNVKAKPEKVSGKDDAKKRQKSGSSTESFEILPSETSKLEVKGKSKSKSRKEVELEEIFGPMSDSDSGIVDSKSHTSCRSSSSTKSVNPPEKLQVSEIYGTDSDSTLCSPPKVEIDTKQELLAEPVDMLDTKAESKKHSKRKKKKKFDDKEKKSKQKKKLEESSMLDELAHNIKDSINNEKLETIGQKSDIYDVFRYTEFDNVSTDEPLKLPKKEKKKKRNRNYKDKVREERKEKKAKLELCKETPQELVSVEPPLTPGPVFTPRSSIESNDGAFSSKPFNCGSHRKSSEDLFDEVFGYRPAERPELVSKVKIEIDSENIVSEAKSSPTIDLPSKTITGPDVPVPVCKQEDGEFSLQQIPVKKEVDDTNKCRAVISQEETEDAVAAILGASFRFNYSEPSPPRVEEEIPFEHSRVSDSDCDHVNPMDDEALQAVQNLESEMPSFHTSENPDSHGDGNSDYLTPVASSLTEKTNAKPSASVENNTDKSFKLIESGNPLESTCVDGDTFKETSDQEIYESKPETHSPPPFHDNVYSDGAHSLAAFEDDLDDSEDKDEDNLVISETPPLSCEPVTEETEGRALAESPEEALCEAPVEPAKFDGDAEVEASSIAPDKYTEVVQVNDFVEAPETLDTHTNSNFVDAGVSFNVVEGPAPGCTWDISTPSVTSSTENANDFVGKIDDKIHVSVDAEDQDKTIALSDPFPKNLDLVDSSCEKFPVDYNNTANDSTSGPVGAEKEGSDNYIQDIVEPIAADLFSHESSMVETSGNSKVITVIGLDKGEVHENDMLECTEPWLDQSGRENDLKDSSLSLSEEKTDSDPGVNVLEGFSAADLSGDTQKETLNDGMEATQYSYGVDSGSAEHIPRATENRGRGRGRKARPSIVQGSQSPRSPRGDGAAGSRVGLLTRSASRQKPKADASVDVEGFPDTEEEDVEIPAENPKGKRSLKNRVSEGEIIEEGATLTVKAEKFSGECKNAFDVFEFHDSEEEGDDIKDKRDDKSKKNRRDNKKSAKEAQTKDKSICEEESIAKPIVTPPKVPEECDKQTGDLSLEPFSETKNLPSSSPSKSPISVRKSKRLLEKDGRNTVDDIIEEVIRNSLNEPPPSSVEDDTIGSCKTRFKNKLKEHEISEEPAIGRDRKICSKSEQSEKFETEMLGDDKERKKPEDGGPRSLIDPVTGLLIPVKESDEGLYVPVPSVDGVTRPTVLGTSKSANVISEEEFIGSKIVEEKSLLAAKVASTLISRSSVVTSVGVPSVDCCMTSEAGTVLVTRPTVLHTSSTLETNELNTSLPTSSDSRNRGGDGQLSPVEQQLLSGSRFSKAQDSTDRTLPPKMRTETSEHQIPQTIIPADYGSSSSMRCDSSQLNLAGPRSMGSTAVSSQGSASHAGIAALPNQTAKVAPQPSKLASQSVVTELSYAPTKEYSSTSVRSATEIKTGEVIRPGKANAERLKDKTGGFQPKTTLQERVHVDRDAPHGLPSSNYDSYVSRGVDSRPGRMIMELLQNPHYLQQQRDIPLNSDQINQANLTPPPSLPSTPPTAHQSEIMRMSGSAGIGLTPSQLNPHYMQQHFLYQHYLRAQQEAAITQRIPYPVHSIRTTFDGRQDIKEKDEKYIMSDDDPHPHRSAHLPPHLRQPSPATSSERSTDSPIIANLYHGSNPRSSTHAAIPQRIVSSHLRSSTSIPSSTVIPSSVYSNPRTNSDFSSAKKNTEALVPPPPPAHQVKSHHHHHHHPHPTPASEAPVNPAHLNPVTPLPTHPRAQVQTPPYASQVPPQADSLLMLLQRYPVMWQGLLALKNDQAAVQMHFVSGNPDVARGSLPVNSDGSTPPLRIAQRMRLEQSQLDGVARKMQMEAEHCMLLALPCGHDHMDVLQQSNNLRSGFITYLQLKQAAGIVNVAAPGSQQPAYVVHIFPSCDFSNENLARIAPDLLHSVADIAHLLIIIATV